VRFTDEIYDKGIYKLIQSYNFIVRSSNGRKEFIFVLENCW